MARKTASIFSSRNPTRPKFDISVAAIETNTGELAAPVKEMTVAIDDVKLEDEKVLQITPVSAPPETVIPVRRQRNHRVCSSARNPLPTPSSQRYRQK